MQGMYVLNNVATGKEIHKEAVLQQLLPHADNTNQSCLNRFLQSNDSRLRTAAIWTIINLTCSSSPGAVGRLVRFRDAGIVSQIKNMVNDPCLDAKVTNIFIPQSEFFSSHVSVFLTIFGSLSGAASCQNSTCSVYDFW